MTGGKTDRSHFSSGILAPVILAICLSWSTSSSADWDVYVSGGLGISGSIVETDGQITNPAPTIDLFETDGDASPLVDGAVGLRIPMDELVPREWLTDVRLPSWPFRIELEAAGLREYELETAQTAQNFYSSITATTLLLNHWVDIPFVELWRPVQYLGGLGRQPRLRQMLEPASLYVGFGIGLGALEIQGSDNVLNGSDKIFDFAWNVGMGVNYALTDIVDLSAGYRFVGIGEQEIDLNNGATPTNGGVTYTPQIHEFRFQVRVEVYDFLSPWR